jgi:hypothetical protein
VIDCAACRKSPIVRIATRQVPSRIAFKPGTFEAKLVAADGCQHGVSRADDRDVARQRAAKMAARRGLTLDPGRASWLDLGWPGPPEELP